MKYNILTLASRSYFPFVDIFLNSLFANSDLEKINKIYLILVDMQDLSDELRKSDKIVLINHDSSDEFSGVHSKGWYNNVKLKTYFLNKILSEIPENESLVLIDSDSLIVKDFSEIINKEFDLQITQMSSGAHVSNSGIKISHIASFMVFNHNLKSKLFVKKWIENIDYLIKENKKLPHETPAMNKTLSDEKIVHDTKIEFLDDRIVSSDLFVGPKTKILHFKSIHGNSHNDLENFEFRVFGVEWSDNLKKNIDYKKYLNLRSFSKWKKSNKKILYSYCDGGLGNRLGSLVGAMHLSQRTNSELVVLWPKTRWCDAEFIDFFEPTLKYITCESNVENLIKKNDITLCDTHIEYSIKNVRHVYPEKDMAETFKKNEKILHSNNTPYSFQSDEEISNLLSILRIKTEIIKIVNKFVTYNQIDDNVVGLHIRKTDHEVLPDSFYYQFIENNFDKKIFICSDDEKIENELTKKYPNTISRKKISYVRKYEEGDWRIGDSFNVYRDKNSVIDGFIDMLILSRTSIVKLSDISSFLKFALYFKKISI